MNLVKKFLKDLDFPLFQLKGKCLKSLVAKRLLEELLEPKRSKKSSKTLMRSTYKNS